MTALFESGFIAALQTLRIEARRVPPRGRHGEHHAREAGTGIEFRDYRAYAPGDDPRRVDWNLYRRFNRLFIRLLDEVRDLPLHLLLDMSDSIWFGEGECADAVRRTAAILAAISLNQLDRVSFHPMGSRPVEPLENLEGKGTLPRALAFLEELGPQGATDLAGSLREFARKPRRSALAVIVSDFYDPAGLAVVEKGLRSLRHRVVLVRIVRPQDRDPDLSGEVRLKDCESEARVDVAVTDRVRARYRERYQAFESELAGLAARLASPLIEIDVSRPVLPQFSVLFPDGVFRP
jgi:uncharacterized protein (DUF58 family)